MDVKREQGPGYEKLEKLLQALKNVDAQVGWFSSSKYPETNIPVAKVAAIQEFGDPSHNIPARSFMRTTIKERGNAWQTLARQEAKLLLTGKTLEAVMDRIAQQAAGDIGKKITEITSPPLKLATVNARKRALAVKLNYTPISLGKPLIFTSHMLNTLAYTVEFKS